MRARLLTRVWAAIAIGTGVGGAAIAQTAAGPAAPDWGQTVTKAAGGQELDAKQVEIVGKLTGYFNQMGDMKGMFVQTSPDGKTLRGKIYVKRPSSFRFEYNRPSRQLIISDGTNIRIQDLDLKTDDNWGIDKTPFRIVMRKDVDLLRDAKVLDASETEDRIFVSLQDKSPDTVGTLKLTFAKSPAIELKEWVTIDSQNQPTKVELTEFSAATGLDPDLFVPKPIGLQRLEQ